MHFPSLDFNEKANHLRDRLWSWALLTKPGSGSSWEDVRIAQSPENMNKAMVYLLGAFTVQQ